MKPLRRRRVVIIAFLSALCCEPFLACVGDEPAAAPGDNTGGDGSASDAPSGDATSDAVTDGGDDAATPPPPATGTLIFADGYQIYNVNVTTVAFDGAGSFIAAGYYQTAAPFTLSGTVSLPATSGANYGFFAKFDMMGNCIWAVPLKSTAATNAIPVAIAAAGGGEMVFVANANGSTVQLDGAAIPTNGADDIVVGRLKANGQQKWMNVYGTPGQEDPSGIVVDGKGHIAVSASFVRTATDLSFGGVTTNPPQTGTFAGIVALLPDDGTPRAIWAKAFPSAGADATGEEVQTHSLAVDPSGNIVTGGEFEGLAEMQFGDTTNKQINSPNGNDDGWLVKLAAGTGETMWSTAIGSPSSGSIHGIACDSTGGVYATFSYGAAFTCGTTPLPAFGSEDVGLAHYDNSGAFLTAKGYGSAAYDIASTIAVDRWDEVILSGWENATVDFGKPATAFAGGDEDAFLVKLSPSLSCLWANAIGGAVTQDEIVKVAVDNSGNVGFGGFLGGSGTVLGKTFTSDATSVNFALLGVANP